MNESPESSSSVPSSTQETEEIPEESVTVDDRDEELTEQHILEAVQKIKEENEQNQMQDANSSVRALVESRLKKFYAAINEVSGGLSSIDLESIPDLMGPIDDDDVYGEDEVFNVQQGDPVEYKDIFPTDFIKASDSIEDLIKSSDFIDCLGKIDVNKDAAVIDESLGDFVENIKKCIKENEVKDEEGETLSGGPHRLGGTDEEPKAPDPGEQVPEEQVIRDSVGFREFVRKLTDAARTDLADIFTGDDLLESEEFGNFCLQLYRMEKSEGVDYCKGDLGTRFLLKPVRDDPEAETYTEKDCEEMWNELHLKSYYDCVTHNLGKAGLTEPLHRVLLIGKIEPSKRNEALSEHDDFIGRIQNKLSDESLKISGIFIVFENLFFHIIETSTDGVDEVIESIAQLVKRNVLLETKVIDIVHEILNRFFKYWKSAYVRRVEKSLKIKTADHEAEFFLRMKELREKFRVLASYLLNVLPEDFERKIDQLMPLDALPEEDDLNYFLQSELFMTAQEYVDKYFNLPEFFFSEEYDLPPVKRFEVCQ